jgi:hypothetical protein
MTINPVMTKTTLAAVLRLLPRLTPDELDQVISHSVALRNPVTAQAPEPADWLLHGIFAALRRRGVVGPNQRPSLKETDAASISAYAKAAPHMRDGLLRGVALKPSTAELDALGQLAAECLAHDLENGPAPVSLQLMLRHTDQILAAVDNGFPGYMRSRQLGLALRKGPSA